MNIADPFTRAEPVYRRAVSKGASPLPLAAFETAEYRRPLWRVVGQMALEALALTGLLGGFVLGASVIITLVHG